MICSIADNMSEGGVKLLKTMAILIAAAVLLYVVLVLVRILGGKLERKTYDRYVDKCKMNGIEPVTYEEYYKRRSEGQRVLWKREENPASSTAVFTTVMPDNQGATNETKSISQDVQIEDASTTVAPESKESTEEIKLSATKPSEDDSQNSDISNIE